MCPSTITAAIIPARPGFIPISAAAIRINRTALPRRRKARRAPRPGKAVQHRVQAPRRERPRAPRMERPRVRRHLQRQPGAERARTQHPSLPLILSPPRRRDLPGGELLLVRRGSPDPAETPDRRSPHSFTRPSVVGVAWSKTGHSKAHPAAETFQAVNYGSGYQSRARISTPLSAPTSRLSSSRSAFVLSPLR